MSDVMSWLAPIGHMVGGGLEMASHAVHGAGTLGRIARVAPGISAAISGIDAGVGVYHGITGETEGERGEGWGRAGWGALGVAAAFNPYTAIAHGGLSIASEIGTGQGVGENIANQFGYDDGHGGFGHSEGH